MIELEIEGKTVELAESWDEITFQQYIDIIGFNKEENSNPMLKAVKIISAISNKPSECEQLLLKITRQDFEDLAKEFEWTNTKIDDVKNDKEILEIDGRNYKIKKDYNKLTIGETVSVETLIANNKNLDPLEVAFGVLLREVDENGVEKGFNEDDFLYVIEQLKTKVMLLDVYNVISFFLSTDKSSSKTSKGFSIHKKQKKSLHVE
jgi:formyltetrahydrofolate hydrolase